MRAPFIKVGAAASFPLTEDPSGLWLPSYGGQPWVPTASAGTSGTNGNQVTGGTLVAPGVGAAVNGSTPADYNLGGTPQTLKSQTNFNANLISVTGLTIITVCQSGPMTTAQSAGTNWFDPSTIVDNAGYIGISETSTGIRGWYYSGGINVPGAIALPGGAAAGQWYVAMVRLNGTTFKFRVNNGADLTVVGGNLNGGVGNTFFKGCNYGSGAPRKGLDMGTIIYKYGITDAQYNLWYNAFKGLYPAMGLP